MFISTLTKWLTHGRPSGWRSSLISLRVLGPYQRQYRINPCVCPNSRLQQKRADFGANADTYGRFRPCVVFAGYGEANRATWISGKTDFDEWHFAAPTRGSIQSRWVLRNVPSAVCLPSAYLVSQRAIHSEAGLPAYGWRARQRTLASLPDHAAGSLTKRTTWRRAMVRNPIYPSGEI